MYYTTSQLVFNVLDNMENSKVNITIMHFDIIIIVV